MFEQFSQPEEIEDEEEELLTIEDRIKDLAKKGIEIPEDIEEKIRGLEQLKNQQVPDWLKKDASNRQVEIEREILAELGALERRFLMKEERRDEIKKNFGVETLKKINYLGESSKNAMERHLLMAENEEDAKKILELWGEFLTQANNLLYERGRGAGARGRKQVEAGLKDAIDAKRKN